MGLQYETMRQYIWDHGWRPVKMKEDGRVVLGWENKEHNRKCQDLEEAYHVTKYNKEVRQSWL